MEQNTFYQQSYVNEQGYVPPAYNNMQAPPPFKKKKHTGLIILVVILAIILCLGGVAIAFKISRDKELKACEDVIDTFFDAYHNQDLDAMYGTYHKDLRENMKSAVLGSMSENDYWEFYNSYFGGAFDVSYSITKHKKVADENLESLLDDITDVYGVSLSVKDAYAFKTEEVYSGPNGVQKQEETIIVANSGGEWVIIAASVDAVLENSVTTESILTPEVPLTEDVTTETTTAQTTEETTTQEIITEGSTTEFSNQIPANSDFDWDTMQFTIEGKTYSLASLTYKDIESMGFYADESILSQEIKAGEYTSIEKAESDNGYIFVKFKNFTNEAKKARDCEIAKVEFSNDGFFNTYDVTLSNGITFGMTYEQVKEVMGSPSDQYASDDNSFISLKYEMNLGGIYPNEVELSFLDGKLTEIFLECYQ